MMRLRRLLWTRLQALDSPMSCSRAPIGTYSNPSIPNSKKNTNLSMKSYQRNALKLMTSVSQPSSSKKQRNSMQRMHGDRSIISYSYRIFRSNPKRYPFGNFRRVTIHRQENELMTDIRSKKDAVRALKALLIGIKRKSVDQKALNDIEAHIPQFNRTDLYDSVNYLMQSRYYKPIILQKIHAALDLACSRKFKITDGHYNDHFFMANAWFQIGLRATGSISSWRCHYIQTFTAAFSSDKIVSSLNEGQFVFLVFLMGINRQNANQIKSFSGPFGEKMAKIVQNLNFGEISLISFGIHMLKLQLGKHDNAIRTALLKSMSEQDMRVVLDQNQEFGIGLIAKVLRERGASEFGALARILQNLHPVLGHFSPFTNVRVLVMVCEYPLGSSQQFIMDLCEIIERQLSSLRIKDFVQILRALQFSNCNENLPFCGRLMSMVNDKLRMHPKSGKMFIQTISLLASERVFKDEYMDEIFSKTNEWPQLRTQTDRAKVLELIIRFTFEFSRSKESREFFDQMVRSESKMSQTVFFKTLIDIATMDINMRLDYPDYRGTRLDSKLRDHFFSLLRKEEDNSWSGLARKQILHDLRTLFPQNVEFEYLLPHSGSRDFVLALQILEKDRSIPPKDVLGCWRDSVIPFPYEQYWNNLQQDHILHLKDLFEARDVTYVAFVSPKRDELDSEYEVCGQPFNKMRQLRLLGFNVAMIPQVPYLKARHKSQWPQFLSKCITSAVFSNSK